MSLNVERHGAIAVITLSNPALMNTPESRALRHVFAAERAAAKVAGVPEGTPLHPIGASASSAPAPWAAASP